jgi:hypothetical protein
MFEYENDIELKSCIICADGHTAHNKTHDKIFYITNNRIAGRHYMLLSIQQDLLTYFNVFNLSFIYTSYFNCIDYLVLISTTILSNFMILRPTFI